MQLYAISNTHPNESKDPWLFLVQKENLNKLAALFPVKPQVTHKVWEFNITANDMEHYLPMANPFFTTFITIRDPGKPRIDQHAQILQVTEPLSSDDLRTAKEELEEQLDAVTASILEKTKAALVITEVPTSTDEDYMNFVKPCIDAVTGMYWLTRALRSLSFTDGDGNKYLIDLHECARYKSCHMNINTMNKTYPYKDWVIVSKDMLDHEILGRFPMIDDRNQKPGYDIRTDVIHQTIKALCKNKRYEKNSLFDRLIRADMAAKLIALHSQPVYLQDESEQVTLLQQKYVNEPMYGCHVPAKDIVRKLMPNIFITDIVCYMLDDYPKGIVSVKHAKLIPMKNSIWDSENDKAIPYEDMHGAVFLRKIPFTCKPDEKSGKYVKTEKAIDRMLRTPDTWSDIFYELIENVDGDFSQDIAQIFINSLVRNIPYKPCEGCSQPEKMCGTCTRRKGLKDNYRKENDNGRKEDR